MDKSLQKKLVGAAVLIALAVIFLPMLLTGKDKEETVTMNIAIPPKPTFEVPNRLEQTGDSVMAERPAELAPLPGSSGAETTVTETTATITEVPAAQKVEAAPVTETAVAAPKQEPVKVAKVTSPPQPRVKATNSEGATGAGYVVQVGSFGKQSNAEGLKDKLAAAGFPAFVEKTQRQQGAIFRVKVGPRTSRSSVDDLRIRLLDEARLEGIIVSHP